MLHIVSGFRRSGTSMMMNALQKGLNEGTVIFRPDLEKFNTEKDGYIPNPQGIWEVGPMYYYNPKFLREIQQFDPGLIKIFFDGLPLLPRGEYKIIYMLRDIDELKRSVEHVEKHLVNMKVNRDFDRPLPFSVYDDYKQEDIDHVLGICEARQDFDMRFVNYRDVIDDPRAVFESLEMPIDVDKCVETIERKFYRFREDRNEHSENRNDGAQAESEGRTREERKAS